MTCLGSRLPPTCVITILTVRPGRAPCALGPQCVRMCGNCAFALGSSFCGAFFMYLVHSDVTHVAGIFLLSVGMKLTDRTRTIYAEEMECLRHRVRPLHRFSFIVAVFAVCSLMVAQLFSLPWPPRFVRLKINMCIEALPSLADG